MPAVTVVVQPLAMGSATTLLKRAVRVVSSMRIQMWRVGTASTIVIASIVVVASTIASSTIIVPSKLVAVQGQCLMDPTILCNLLAIVLL
jgi:hypothetical protein